jgi:TetR/AcrR family transcriptional regulator, regulator of cefoperazone and chloramphenicol sensitivity
VLIMRSVVSGSDSRAADDLTTKARIRDASIVMFGKLGFAATTVRAIATDVGVSPALLLHHFGSKDGLRKACDDHVLNWYGDQVAELAADDSAETVLAMVDRTPDLMPLATYIRRSLTEGGQLARRMFYAAVEDTERYLRSAVASGRVRPTDDEHGRALMLVVASFGGQLLADHVAPAGTPADQVVAAASERLMLPGLELYTYGVFTDSEYLDAFRARAARNSAARKNNSSARKKSETNRKRSS